MNDELKALHEIRDLLRLMAEPQIAARDQKLRQELKRLVGRSVARAKAVLLMDGTRSQAEIYKTSGLGQGHLSTLVKNLGNAGLLNGECKLPSLVISIPTNFFDAEEDS